MHPLRKGEILRLWPAAQPGFFLRQGKESLDVIKPFPRLHLPEERGGYSCVLEALESFQTVLSAPDAYSSAALGVSYELCAWV